MPLDTWFIYFIAVIGLTLAPGPSGLLVLTHGVMYGQKKTLFTISGGMFGFVLLMALTMFGISALLLASANLLSIFKWVGGAYLVWLGIKMWLAPPLELKPVEKGRTASNFSLFRQGLLAAIANPKVLLFFAAFLPQFINPELPLFTQFVVMAATFAFVEFCVEYLIAGVAIKLRPWLARTGKRFNQVSGGLFAAIGTSLPLTQ
ncbi:LysE family translocator [Vibrio sp. T187]|uniref:LysE family translocator n=1 Tax=Vibrio TaxID=662 RepID=UPI0010C9BED7|nr:MULTISPECIES: LysE family translocator [Vibrio]MBW3698174.1 LysE family translocator [Vibrio sp. T187]